MLLNLYTNATEFIFGSFMGESKQFIIPRLALWAGRWSLPESSCSVSLNTFDISTVQMISFAAKLSYVDTTKIIDVTPLKILPKSLLQKEIKRLQTFSICLIGNFI